MARYSKKEKLWTEIYGIKNPKELEEWTKILFMYDCPYYIVVRKGVNPYYYVHCKVNEEMKKTLDDDFKNYIRKFV